MSAAHYPEYEDLAALAQRRSRGFTDPAQLGARQQMMSRRGADWCTAVLGRSVGTSLHGVSVFEVELLVAADEADIDPPLPEHILQSRAQARELRRLQDDQYERLRLRDEQAWEQALSQCSISIEVRANVNGRRYGTGLNSGPLRHVVTLVPAHSGKRVHLQDRALCETSERHKPLVLGSAVQEPATCVRCLKYTASAIETVSD
jgi:hypothetical protein